MPVAWRGRHDGDGGYSRRAAGSLAGPISRLLVREDAIIGASRLRLAIVALLWLAAAATVFDGLQATAFVLRAQGMVWLPSAIHLSSFFVVMIPVCYWLAIRPAGARCSGGAGRGVCRRLVAGTAQFILLEWKAARPGGTRPDPDRSPWGSNLRCLSEPMPV